MLLLLNERGFLPSTFLGSTGFFRISLGIWSISGYQMQRRSGVGSLSSTSEIYVKDRETLQKEFPSPVKLDGPNVFRKGSFTVRNILSQKPPHQGARLAKKLHPNQCPMGHVLLVCWRRHIYSSKGKIKFSFKNPVYKPEYIHRNPAKRFNSRKFR